MDAETTGPQPSEGSRPLADSGITELIAVLITVVLADITIYRGHGYAGLTVFFLGTLSLLYAGKKRRQTNPPLWIAAGMPTLLAGHLLWYGSPLQVIIGLVLLIAFATALDGQTPYLLAVVAVGSQSLVAGFRAFAEHFSRAHRIGSSLNRPGILNVILPALAFVVFSALFVLANPDAVSFLGRHLEAVISAVRKWFIHMALTPTEPIFWMVVALIAAGLLRPILRLSSMPAFVTSVGD